MRVPVLAVPLIAFAFPLVAQEIHDSLPFRVGQWGVQFVGPLTGAFGVLKFRSPSRAWMAEIDLTARHQETTADSSTSVSVFTTVNVLLGTRTYRPLGSKVVGYHTLGILVGYSHSSQNLFPTGRSRTSGWQLGPFLHIGGTYLVTPHLGIGASGQAGIFYMWATNRTPAAPTTRIWALTASTAVGLQGAIFF
jgi:hypothetical protein